MDKAAARRKVDAWAAQERVVYGTNCVFALFPDKHGRAASKWEHLRRKAGANTTPALTGAALEQAVMGIAMVDPSLVKIQAGA